MIQETVGLLLIILIAFLGGLMVGVVFLNKAMIKLINAQEPQPKTNQRKIQETLTRIEEIVEAKAKNIKAKESNQPRSNRDNLNDYKGAEKEENPRQQRDTENPITERNRPGYISIITNKTRI